MLAISRESGWDLGVHNDMMIVKSLMLDPGREHSNIQVWIVYFASKTHVPLCEVTNCPNVQVSRSSELQLNSTNTNHTSLALHVFSVEYLD